ncbi:MAG: hypothetical protein EA377_06465 [Phycisphaerales bacterium]|nr:MAG: hypothetical protein EA377_06465 [Phycisphaerales bacterium]
MFAAVLAGAVIVCASSRPADASLVLFDGNALFDSSLPSSATGTSGGSTNFRPSIGSSANHLSQQSWHFRIDGMHNRQFMFSESQGNPTTSGMFSSTGSYEWSGLAGGILDAKLTIELQDGRAPNEATLTQTMSLTNTSSSAFTISLFHYADINAGGAPSLNNANALNSNLLDISKGNEFVHWQGIGADAYDYQHFNRLFNKLTSPSIVNLSSPQSPLLAADFTGAFQWTLDIDPGDTVSVTSIISSNIVIPAPGAVLLLAGSALISSRRRRM